MACSERLPTRLNPPWLSGSCLPQVDYGHAKGVKMGFYQNGCACGARPGC